MNKEKVSSRTKRLIVLADSMNYSREDLKVLYGILSDEFDKDTRNNYVYDLWEEIGSIYEKGHTVDSLTEEATEDGAMIGDTTYYKLDLPEYLLVNHRKVFLFLALVPFKNVPLYTNDPKLAVFARWRLITHL